MELNLKQYFDPAFICTYLYRVCNQEEIDFGLCYPDYLCYVSRVYEMFVFLVISSHPLRITYMQISSR